MNTVSAERSIFLLHERDKIYKALKDEGINALLLKGAAFVEFLYDEITKRPFGDVDILVREKDLQTCDEILKESGYEKTTAKNFKAYLYIKKDVFDIYLDVHFYPFIKKNPFQKYAFQIPVDALFENTYCFEHDGSSFYTLSIENTLLYLCAEILTELYPERYVLDMEALLRVFKGKLNWEKVMDSAGKWGMKNTLYYACDALYEKKPSEFQSLIPQEVIESLNARRTRHGLVKRMLIKRKNLAFYRLFVYLSAIEKPSERVRAVMELPFYFFTKEFSK